MMTKEERLVHKAKYGTWYMPNGGEEMSSQMKDFVDGLPEDSYEKKAERHQKEGLQETIKTKVCINGIEVGNFTDAERFLVRGAIASCRKWAEKEKIDVSNLLKKLDAVMEPIDPK